MADLHQATFTWPAGPSKVIVTGTFDNWSATTELSKTDSGFSKTVNVPWDAKIIYKYVVDGQWKASSSSPQEYDGNGNLNNIYTSPPKPTTEAPPASVPVEEVKATVTEVAESATATAGTTSVLSYVTSGLGAAIATVTGYDPVNPQQIPVEEAPTPVAAAPASEPEPVAAPSSEAPAPIKDEPIVVPPTETVEEKAIPIPNAPEPYKETNGTLPAELESPVTDATSTSHPTEGTTTTTGTAVDAPTTEAKPTTPTKKEGETTPRTSNASPPTTPRKFSFPKPRRSGSITGSSIATDTSPTNTKRKKRDSFFGKIKDVFHSPKKDKVAH